MRRLLLTSVLISSYALAQAPAAKPLPGDIASHPEWPKAAPADVATAGSIVAALYDVISGAAGQKQDWQRFKSLFLSSGRLVPTRAAPR